jgi:hypothetical protein
MGRRPLALSALIFALLLVVTVWALRERNAPEAAPYFTLARPIPDTLLVAYGPDTTVVVPRGRTGWRVVRPVDYPADGVVVNAMLKRLHPLPVSERRFPLYPNKMDTYGMRHPRVTIRAAYRGGLDPDTLWIGTFTLNSRYDYVRNGSSDEVALVDARITKGYLMKTTVEIRQHMLLPFAEDRATAVRLFGPDGNPRVELLRRPDLTWWVKWPISGPAGDHEMEEYLSGLSHMVVSKFIREEPGPLAPFGLEPPRAMIRVALEGEDSLSLALGDPVPREGALGENLVYAVTGSRAQVLGVSNKYLPVLLRTADSFRDPVPFGFGLDVVDSVRVAYGDDAATFVPADTSRTGLNDREVLGHWTELRAKAFSPARADTLKAAGLSPPRGRMTWFGGGDTLAVEWVGVVRDHGRAIRIEGGTRARPREVMWIPESRIDPLWGYLTRRVREEARIAREGGSP